MSARLELAIGCCVRGRGQESMCHIDQSQNACILRTVQFTGPQTLVEEAWAFASRSTPRLLKMAAAGLHAMHLRRMRDCTLFVHVVVNNVDAELTPERLHCIHLCTRMSAWIQTGSAGSRVEA